jgi:hypothetical protein
VPQLRLGVSQEDQETKEDHMSKRWPPSIEDIEAAYEQVGLAPAVCVYHRRGACCPLVALAMAGGTPRGKAEAIGSVDDLHICLGLSGYEVTRKQVVDFMAGVDFPMPEKEVDKCERSASEPESVIAGARWRVRFDKGF